MGICSGLRLVIIGFESSRDIMSEYNDYLIFRGMRTECLEHRKYDSIASREAERSCGSNGYLQQRHVDVTAYDLRKWLMIHSVLRSRGVLGMFGMYGDSNLSYWMNCAQPGQCVIVGVCVVCVYEDCTVENAKYVSTCSSASSDGLLWLPSAYRVTQAYRC